MILHALVEIVQAQLLHQRSNESFELRLLSFCRVFILGFFILFLGRHRRWGSGRSGGVNLEMHQK